MTDATDRPVVGVDGLPLGHRAAVAIGSRLVAELDLSGADPGPDPLGDPDDRSGAGLERRILDAVDRAGQITGLDPVEVRVLAIDDGVDGGRFARIGDLLAARGIGFVVLDPAVAVDVTDDDPDDVRSSWRARAAALW